MEPKRIVVIHAGGLWQIVGTSPPPYPGYFEFLAHGGLVVRPASLIQVHPRYVLYREIVPTPTRRFDDFHPEQL